MIKLIATDMDGTLLDNNGNFPPDFFDILKLLKSKGIVFVVASGRSYATLKQQFAGIANDISFICDNGAFIVEKGLRTFMSVIEPKYINLILEDCLRLNVCPLLCGTKGTYHLPLKGSENAEINKYYINQITVDNIFNINDDIFKIAIFDEKGAEANCSPAFVEKYSSSHQVIVSGRHWIDIMNFGICKGNALKNIQSNLNIFSENTMAFGDYLNDIDLLENAEYSYAVSNAHPLVKKAAKFEAPSNQDSGVTYIIKKYLSDKDKMTANKKQLRAK